MISATFTVTWWLVTDRMVWVFQKMLLLWYFHAQQSLDLHRMQWGQRRMARLAWADRKAIITQITALDNCAEHKIMHNSEYTIHQTLRWMGFKRQAVRQEQGSEAQFPFVWNGMRFSNKIYKHLLNTAALVYLNEC